MKKREITEAFTILAKELQKSGIEGEIGVVGGAAMVLAYDARAATKDVDAIFKPASDIRTAAAKVAKRLSRVIPRQEILFSTSPVCAYGYPPQNIYSR